MTQNQGLKALGQSTDEDVCRGFCAAVWPQQSIKAYTETFAEGPWLLVTLFGTLLLSSSYAPRFVGLLQYLCYPSFPTRATPSLAHDPAPICPPSIFLLIIYCARVTTSNL